MALRKLFMPFVTATRLKLASSPSGSSLFPWPWPWVGLVRVMPPAPLLQQTLQVLRGKVQPAVAW